jgi:Peptidase inhibitor family I36
MNKTWLLLLVFSFSCLLFAQYQRKLSNDDQRRFDSYYSRWLEYQRTNNRGELASMEKRMRAIYGNYAIPYNVPFERIASPGLVPPSRSPAPGWPGGPSWGHPAFPRRGACFYQDPNFGGSYFCMRAGMSYANVPPGFNDRITSIRVMGADVAIFNDTNFRGVGGRIRRDVANLRRWRLPTDPSRTWNDRISSIQVR